MPSSSATVKLRIACKCGQYAYQHVRNRGGGEQMHYYVCVGCQKRVTYNPEDGMPRGELADVETRRLRANLAKAINRLKVKGLYGTFRDKTNKRYIRIGLIGKKELKKLHDLVLCIEKGSL